MLAEAAAECNKSDPDEIKVTARTCQAQLDAHKQRAPDVAACK
jgi:hypothetical protein